MGMGRSSMKKSQPMLNRPPSETRNSSPVKLRERAANYQGDNAMKVCFQQPPPPAGERPAWIQEDDGLTFAGRMLFSEILCRVPLPCPDPLEYPRRPAKDELVCQDSG